jgi:hypothetical protein
MNKKHFYFKVNNSKLNDYKAFEQQVNKIIQRIKDRHKLLNNDITIQSGNMGNDVIYNGFTLVISVNCSE